MKLIHDLVIFNQCAKVQNFTQAAFALNLTPSSVVKTIQRIENYYGVKLFQRSTRAVVLTEYGIILLRHSDRIISEMQAVETQYQVLNNPFAGLLKISLPNVEYIFSKSLSQFIQQYPKIKLDITFTDQHVNLISERYDVVIRFGTLKDSELIAKKLGQLEMLMVCAPSYIFDSHNLKNNRYLLYKYPNSGQVEICHVFKNKIEYANSIILNSITSIKNLCIHGSGIALLPSLLIKDELANKSLIVLPNTAYEQKEVHIMWVKSGGMSPQKRLFIDFFIQQFNTLGE